MPPVTANTARGILCGDNLLWEEVFIFHSCGTSNSQTEPSLNALPGFSECLLGANNVNELSIEGRGFTLFSYPWAFCE